MKLEYNTFSISGINALPRFGNKKTVAYNIIPSSESIALYIHIPFCKTVCSFCMLRRGSKAVNEVSDEFVDTLLLEIGLYLETLENVQVSSIYFGGGTPSMLNPKQFERILLRLNNAFSFAKNIEITFEGEASSLKKYDLLECLKSNNVKRISFGLQTFDEKIRQLLGRTDEVYEIYELKNKLDKLGFEEINVDYMYNLPNTDINFILRDLEKLKSFAPTSIDCHPLKYISCSKYLLKDIVDNKMTIPNANLRIEMFKHIRNWCFENGFIEQFVDQYSKKSLQNSNIYMKHLYGLEGGEYIGFGPGARSHYGGFGFSNMQSIEEYSKTILLNTKPFARTIEAPLQDNYITCFPKRNDTLKKADIEKSASPEYFLKKINNLVLSKYIIFENERFSLTDLGLDWYQNLQEELLSENQKRRHLESIESRVLKFKEFNGYFNNIGDIIKISEV